MREREREREGFSGHSEVSLFVIEFPGSRDVLRLLNDVGHKLK